jgi:hypothetical protein
VTGYVYALTNPSFPNLVKIGRTVDLNKRLGSLYSSGVPTPFKCILVKEVSNYDKVEKLLHKLLEDDRVNNSREFFKTSEDKLAVIFELIGLAPLKEEVKEDIDRPLLTLKVPNVEAPLIGYTITDLFHLLRHNSYSASRILPKYQTVISRRNKGWTLEQAFGFAVPPNYTEVDALIGPKGEGFEYYPERPTEDGNRIPLVCRSECRVYLSQYYFAEYHDIPADYVCDKLKAGHDADAILMGAYHPRPNSGCVGLPDKAEQREILDDLSNY